MWVHIPARSLRYAQPIPVCRRLGSTQPLPLPPMVSASLAPQSETHSLLAFALVRNHTHYIPSSS